MSSKGIARGSGKDTVSTGHQCDATTTANQCSSDVIINGKGACRLGDTITIHNHKVGDSCVPHTASITSASSSVFVNGIAIARDTDSADSGSISSGSTDVFAG
jgi:uncharacterized Zn-binding protein involved in type VI secretion